MEILHHSYFKLLIISSIFITTVSALDPITNSLLSLKYELVDDFHSLNDWFEPPGENPPGKILACSWSGVTCYKNSTVLTGLDLSMKNLGGEISRMEFYLFLDLVDLNISYNSFSGNLPVGIFNLSNLKSLDISRNNFSGNFPSGSSNLRNLVVLDAFSNSFSGELPADISEISSLKVVNFAGSYFSGPIPSEYGSFKSLEFIHLAGNYLNGSLPPELGRLKTVTHMEIGYNSYQGSIPWQFGNMSELQYLDIAGANLSGTIPEQLSNLSNLHTLFLFRNILSGPIPSDLSKIKNLTSLDLSDNLLSGPIPQSFSELNNLRLLSLMYNDMSGSVPKGVAQIPNLDTLLIWNNFFSGSLPKELGRFSKLKWVDVSTNNFVGSIPPDICAAGELAKLILFSNNFTGGLSPSISNCSSLVRLRLEDNSFSGVIPFNFSNLPEITYIDLSRNKFTGGIPSDMSLASNLEYFNVSNNFELGGIIPPKTWYLPLIQNFSASSCNLSGHIPPFESCKHLSVIELSTNHFSGTLPNISLCGSIQLLNVSFNDLSGSIPSEKVFRLMDKSSFLGNPKLCGAPLRPCHHGKEIPNGLENGSKRTQKIAWILIICAAVVLFLTLSLFGVFYFRRKSQGEWKMVSFHGLPHFTANDILRSFNSIETMEIVPTLSGSVCKVVLPTGITVLVRKIEWETKKLHVMLEFMNYMGNARHKNLVRLLGFCYNKQMAYLLYDYLPKGNLAENIKIKRDWAAKCKIVIGIARGLCFLHHDCFPAIPHGDLSASSIVFDENMEPHLTEYGFKHLVQLNGGSVAATMSRIKAGEFSTAMKEEHYADVYNFGEIILEIMTNGRLKNAGRSIQSKPKEALLREIYKENEIDSSKSFQEEIQLVTEVALGCTRTRPSDRPSMEDVLKLLSGLKPQKL